MKKVLVRGPVLTHSGYGNHARMIARYFLERKDVETTFEVLPWGDTPWILNRSACDGLIGEIMDRSGYEHGEKFDISAQIQLPNEWNASLASYNVGITAGVETDICNPEWAMHCNKMNKVIVPAEHVRKNLLSPGNVTTQIDVVPESLPDELLKSDAPVDIPLDLETDFNFLLFGQITGNNTNNDRKNIFFTIKWFCEVFKHDRDVGLIIKTNMGRQTHIDRKLVENVISQVVRECRGPNLGPKIYLLHGDLSDSELRSLYRHPKVKAMVSLTHGEGFGLPLLEAAGSGLPIIATGWSGHTDFLNHGRYIDIDYDLKEIHESRVDGKIFMHGAKWAYPNEDSFKRKIRKFKESSSTPREWAADLQKKIVDQYSFHNIAKMYNSVFQDQFK